MVIIALTTDWKVKKQGTKTVYVTDKKVTNEITEQEYKNIVDSASFFRRLGGSVSQERAYTCYGYKVVKDTATSTDKSTKTVRTFNFQWIDK
jgi:hypothetical protein